MMAAPTVDPGRVRRALLLDVDELEDGTFVVRGGSEPHHVRGKRCDCADSIYHDGPCKHRVATHFHQRLDPAVRAALREVCR